MKPTGYLVSLAPALLLALSLLFPAADCLHLKQPGTLSTSPASSQQQAPVSSTPSQSSPAIPIQQPQPDPPAPPTATNITANQLSPAINPLLAIANRPPQTPIPASSNRLQQPPTSPVPSGVSSADGGRRYFIGFIHNRHPNPEEWKALASLYTHIIRPLYLHYPSVEASRQQRKILQAVGEHTAGSNLIFYAHIPDNIAEILLLEKKREENTEWKAFVGGLGQSLAKLGIFKGVHIKVERRLTRDLTDAVLELVFGNLLAIAEAVTGGSKRECFGEKAAADTSTGGLEFAITLNSALWKVVGAVGRSQSLATILKRLYCVCKFIVLKDNREWRLERYMLADAEFEDLVPPGGRGNGLLPLTGSLWIRNTSKSKSGAITPAPKPQSPISGHVYRATYRYFQQLFGFTHYQKLVLYAANAVLFEREGKEEEVSACSFHRYCQLLTEQALGPSPGPLQGLKLVYNAVRKAENVGRDATGYAVGVDTDLSCLVSPWQTNDGSAQPSRGKAIFPMSVEIKRVLEATVGVRDLTADNRGSPGMGGGGGRV